MCGEAVPSWVNNQSDGMTPFLPDILSLPTMQTFLRVGTDVSLTPYYAAIGAPNKSDASMSGGAVLLLKADSNSAQGYSFLKMYEPCIANFGGLM